MIDNAKQDWRSIDCGSHIGVYSMLLSYLCPYGVVYAFEVCQRSIDKMFANMAYNEYEHKRDFSNIFSIQVALGDRRGMFKETVWQTGITAGNYGETQGEFAFDTLDNFANIIKLDKLNLIKIDVDGWEFETLMGAEDTIKKFMPYLVFETSSLHFRNHNFKEVQK
jgi:FkbM family methyltransferase